MRGAMMPSAGTGAERLSGEALAWIARLPLLTEAQLGQLLGIGDWTVRSMLGELRRHRLVTSVVADSPEFVEPLRLYHLTNAGTDVVAQQLGAGRTDGDCELPATRDELLARLIRAEATVGLADVIAMLADALRDHAVSNHGRGISLDAAGSTLWAPHRGRSSAFPESADAWVRLRVGSLRATVLLAWDRASVPRAHRRARVAAWYRADDTPHAPWGASLPPVLVVCPNDRAVAEWTNLFDTSAGRRGRDLLRAAATTLPELAARGPLDQVWRQAGSGVRTTLPEMLTWRALESVGAVWPSVEPAIGQQPRRQVPRVIHGTADRSPGEMPMERSGTSTDGRGRAERRAALTTGLSATQKILVEWIGQHPLLAACHLSTYLMLPGTAVTVLLDGLVRAGLITVDAIFECGASPGPRYILTDWGAGYLAARDGVPLHRYLSEGTIAVETVATDCGQQREAAGDVRLRDLRRRPAHTAGVLQFAHSLAREAAQQRACGRDHRVLAWLNAVEGQEWFRYAGRTGHIWPDARFRYRADGRVYDLLLEWDRGLVRRRDYARKLTAYAAYVGAHPGCEQRTRLLIATARSAGDRLRDELERVGQFCPRLLTMTRIITHGDVNGEGITRALFDPLQSWMPGQPLGGAYT
jgi:hypothetical protein